MSCVAEKRVFFDISVDERQIGRIEIKLFVNEAPKTCENFRALCTGEVGRTPDNKAHLHYKGNLIHRIVKNFMIQGGDITEGDGRGGYSIYGRYFEDEKFELKHTRPYLLSMANKGPNSNSSQFFITTASAPHCNGKHVVFGEVVKGKEVIDVIENIEVDDKSKPQSQVRIYNCGELIRKVKPMKTDEELLALEIKKKKEEIEKIPDIPKSWLCRDESRSDRGRAPMHEKHRNSSRSRSTLQEHNHYDEKRDRRDGRDGYQKRHDKRRDEEGITVRGRGGIRYKRERSLTPEYWRRNAPTKRY